MKEKNLGNLGFSSQLGVAVTLIAGSVGLGNIWRFPRVVATNGGGTFLFEFTIIMVLVCLPIMIGEHIMGKATRHGMPGAFRDFLGKNYTWLGTTVTLVMWGSMAYYTVLTTWTLYYFGLALTRGYYGQDKEAIYNSMVDHNVVVVCIFLALILLACIITYKGIRAIESISKIFLPILLVCLLIIAVRSLTLPGAINGLNFLFEFKPAELADPKTWLEALTQAIWSAGPGWGLCVTLAIFTKKKADASLTTTLQLSGDGMVAMIAGLAVIPAIFALTPDISAAKELVGQGNYGLTYISLTGLFEGMPGGYLFGVLFFLSLFLAAFSSVVTSIIILTRPLQDSGVNAKKAIVIVAVLLAVRGIPSAWSSSFLANQDWYVGQMYLLGALFSCFAFCKFGLEKMRTKYINNEFSGLRMGKWWNYSVMVISPVIVLVMFFWWSYQSISWDAEWWNPLASTSLMTFIVQCAVTVGAALIFNNKVADSIKHKYFDGENIPEIPAELQD